MKRCPKCGTVLDDDKKRCYMCGADLLRSSITQFGESFDAQIGATVSTSQDNVFNNVDNINANLNDAVGNANPDTSTYTSSGADFYNNNGLDGLNSMQYDNRTAIEKIFSGNQRFKSKSEINAEVAMKKRQNVIPVVNTSETPNSNQVNNLNTFNNTNSIPTINNTGSVNEGMEQNPFANTGVGNTNVGPVNQEFTGMMNVNKQDIMPPLTNSPVTTENDNGDTGLQDKPVKKKIEMPKISWGDNLKNSTKDKVNFGGNFKIDVGLIVNTACFIVFIIGVVIVYFKVIKPKEDISISFGGLSYKMNEKFILKEDMNNRRYYKYGENCSLQVSFGTSTSTTYIDDYFEEVKNSYTEDNGYFTQRSNIDIQGNKWEALEVLQIANSELYGESVQPKVKYRYVSIIYKNNYYHINYANTDSNTECSAMYDEMLNSMEFK